ncbi:hypothetical protein GQ42DRAFT_156119 [Ramicandelaber brevisporus]|nr:hypothetical protein GQ42DRAFT_156119 [Ramicandelaber brevisporus]
MLERHSSLLTTHLSSTEQTIADQQSYLAELDALEQAANLRLNQAYEDAKVGLDVDMDQALTSIADKVTGLVQLLDDPAYLGLFAHNTAHSEKVDTGYDEHLALLRQLCKQLINQAGVVSGTNDPALPSLLKSHGVNNVPSLLQKANVMATEHVNTFSAEDLLSLQIAIDHLKAAQAEMYAECIEVVLKEVANLLAIVIIQHQSCQLELDQMQDVGSLLQQVTDTINERIGSAQESRNAMDAKNGIIRDSRRLMDSKLLTVEHGGDTLADQQSYLAELDALEQAANLRLNQAYEDAKVGLDIDMDQTLTSIADKVTGLVQLLDDPAYLGLFAHNTSHSEKVDAGYDEHLALLRQLCKQLITQAGVVSGTNDPALPSLLKSHGVNNVPSLLQKANVMATEQVNTFSAEDLLSLQIAIDHLKAAQAEMYAECIEVVLREVANLLAIVIIQHQSCQLELDQMQDVGSLLQQVTDTINERIGLAQESRNAIDAKNGIIRDSRRLMDSKLLTVEHGGDVSGSLNAAEAIIDDLQQSLTQKQQLTQESNLDTMTAEIESLANQVEQLARININSNPQIDDKCTELKSSATNLRNMISDATTLSKIDSFMKSKLESL